jgi:DNA-binding transcriptional regulator YiaG
MGITVEGIKNATYEDYQREKNKAINTIGDEPKKDNKAQKDLKILKAKIAKVKFPIQTKQEFAKSIGLTIRTLQKWAENSNEKPETLENSGFEGD